MTDHSAATVAGITPTRVRISSPTPSARLRTRSSACVVGPGHPFVLNGVVRNWTIREWNEALVPRKPARQPSADPVSWLDVKARNGQLVIFR